MICLSFLLGVAATLVSIVLILLIIPRKRTGELVDHMAELHGYWKANNEHSRERNEALMRIADALERTYTPAQVAERTGDRVEGEEER